MGQIVKIKVPRGCDSDSHKTEKSNGGIGLASGVDYQRTRNLRGAARPRKLLFDCGP
jgi:hypothetical protein